MKALKLNQTIVKINRVILRMQAMNESSRQINHFYHMKIRLIKGLKLTKKMSENLAWIEKDKP